MGHTSYCEHGVKSAEFCVQCDNDSLRGEIEELHESHTRLLERIDALEKALDGKCNHSTELGNNSCSNCGSPST